VKAGSIRTGDAVGAEEADHVPEPLHLHVEVHHVAHVETPVPEELRGERGGAAHREVGPAREVLGAPTAQVGPHEREAQRVRCRVLFDSRNQLAARRELFSGYLEGGAFIVAGLPRKSRTMRPSLKRPVARSKKVSP
jgi:hypothetical protein